MNLMRQIRIEKITLNIGAGKSASKLEKGVKLLKLVTGLAPVKTITQKRIAAWGLRPGLPIGCKVTIRGEEAFELAKKLVIAVDKALTSKQVDNAGNIAFGVQDYIDVPGVEYDPEIGSTGFQVCITLSRPGFRIKKRKINQHKLGIKHIITKEEAKEFMKSNFEVLFDEE